MAGIDWKQEAQPREKIYFFVILVMMLVAFGRLFWGPRLQKTTLAEKELETILLRVKTLKDRLAEVKQQQLAAPAVPVQQKTAAQPDDRFAPYLRGEIKTPQQVMAETVRQVTGPQVLKGISLGGLAFGSEADAGTYLSVPLEVNVEGPFAALVQYLDAIEKLPLMMTVDNVALTAPPDMPGRLQAKLFTTVYVVKSAAAITVGGSQAPTPGAPASGTPPAGGKQ